MIQSRLADRQGGLALVAVLWIVAALSILVTGMVQSQRDEIRLVAAARQTVQGSALSNAAIQLVLQEMAARDAPVTRLRSIEVAYAGITISVEITPLNGLVDINRAPEALMTALFTVAGKLAPDNAEALAKVVVGARASLLTQRGSRFEAIEDLLLLPGVDFDLYARLSLLITTDVRGIGRVNVMAAPEGVLLLLSGGNSGWAAQVAARRAAGDLAIDTSDLPTQFIATAATNRFRLVARVPLSDGRRLLSSRLVELGTAARDGVPWRIFHSEDRFEPMPQR